MSEHEVDDVAFLTGDSGPGLHKPVLYETRGVAVCSQRRALIIATAVLAVLLTIALVIAFTGPQTYCPCAGKKPDDFDYEDDKEPVIPVATNNEIFPWNNVRLPDSISPTRYRIHIHPNLTTLIVKGQVVIDFTVAKETNFIVLHSKNLTVHEYSVTNDKGDELPISRFLEYPPAQQIYIELVDPLPYSANYSLNIRYTSRLGRELEGFYLSSYVNKKGETKFLATTHFEPTYARAAFPCFDEPEFKAKFKMSIVRDRFHIALFNMPIFSTEDAGFYMGTGLLRDEFTESVEMSTYLVAFVVCDYQHITSHTKSGVSVSVYSPADLISQARFALDTATDMMDHYTEFFGVPYPLPKQDLIVIPDFAAGAMENWGLITYRETSVLYDSVETSAFAHQWVAIVVAHELAHQWFGNLVTMKWWNDLWLNEGFASFLEYTGVDHVMPDWKMMDQFILDKTQPALKLDALATSHAISVDVHDPTEIEAIFDTISYNKGAAILYMLEKFLEEDTLRLGLNDYLITHMYGNAATEDLWAAFSKHSNQSVEVKRVMDSWTQQMGFPLVTIERIGDASFRATQTRFLLTSSLNQSIPDVASPFNYKWFVPLSYYTNVEPDVVRHVWMNLTDVEFEVSASTKWIKANVNQSGFYRVTYSNDMWMEIIATLKSNHRVFSPADRASLIDDVFTLCRAGVLNATIPLELSLYLTKERDYVPWATALEHFQTWTKRLAESSAYRLFFEFMRRILAPVARDIGWEDTGPHLHKLMRSEILSSAILCNVADTVKEARARFRLWMENGQRVPPNLREVVYAAGIKYGGEKEWQFCWGKYNTTGVPSERKLLLLALGVSNDPWILARYLKATLDRNAVKPQDLKIALGVVASNPEGQLLAWRHLKAHWGYMQTLFGNGTFTLGSMISAVTAHFATEYDHQEVKQFFYKQNVGSGQRALEQSLETIRLNIHWVRSNDQVIYEWLRGHLKL